MSTPRKRKRRKEKCLRKHGTAKRDRVAEQ
jgi:hypothetical protein